MSTPFAVDPRTQELLDHQLVTGRRLPLPVAVIIDFENAGAIVDLDTGAIFASEALWLAHIVAMSDEAVING